MLLWIALCVRFLRIAEETDSLSCLIGLTLDFRVCTTLTSYAWDYHHIQWIFIFISFFHFHFQFAVVFSRIYRIARCNWCYSLMSDNYDSLANQLHFFSLSHARTYTNFIIIDLKLFFIFFPSFYHIFPFISWDLDLPWAWLNWIGWFTSYEWINCNRNPC